MICHCTGIPNTTTEDNVQHIKCQIDKNLDLYTGTSSLFHFYVYGCQISIVINHLDKQFNQCQKTVHPLWNCAILPPALGNRWEFDHGWLLGHLGAWQGSRDTMETTRNQLPAGNCPSCHFWWYCPRMLLPPEPFIQKRLTCILLEVRQLRTPTAMLIKSQKWLTVGKLQSATHFQTQPIFPIDRS